MKKRIGLLAYGETGSAALRGLMNRFEVLWIIVPPEELQREVQKSKGVEDLARSINVRVVKTNSSQEIEKLIRESKPLAVVISSYNKILPAKILSQSKFINIHHGDLPNFRGRANINWAIILGKKEIGLIFHEAIPNLDEGSIYEQIRVPITYSDTVRTVYEKFNKKIEKDVARVVQRVIDGDLGIPQKGNATYCCTRLPQDGYIDWNKTSLEIYNLIRGVTKPYAGAFTFFEGKKMIIWESEIPQNPPEFVGRIPGRVVAIHKDRGVEILTGDSTLIIRTVSYNGEEQNASNFINSVKKTLGVDMELIMKLLLS